MADASRDATTRQVPAKLGRLLVCDRPGDEPALVLMHGFPDDSRIYNRLVTLLSPRPLPTSPACSRGPTCTWWTARPTGRNGTGPRRCRS